MITLKDTSDKQETYNYLRAQWRKIDRERKKYLEEHPAMNFANGSSITSRFPREAEWDELRIAWAVTKGDIRMIKYQHKVLAMMRAIVDNLFLYHDMPIAALELTLHVKKSEQMYFTRAIYELEDQERVTIKRDMAHDVPIPGSQISGAVGYVSEHGVPKLVCGTCVIEWKQDGQRGLAQ